MIQTDLTALLPEKTAHILKDVYHSQIALLPYGTLSDEVMHWTRLVWHERLHEDPVMQWFRSMFALYASDTKTDA